MLNYYCHLFRLKRTKSLCRFSDEQYISCGPALNSIHIHLPVFQGYVAVEEKVKRLFRRVKDNGFMLQRKKLVLQCDVFKTFGFGPHLTVESFLATRSKFWPALSRLRGGEGGAYVCVRERWGVSA